MFKTIVGREIQAIIYSQVFQISFLLVTALFIVGTVSFVKSYNVRLEQYSMHKSEYMDELKDIAENNLTRFAVNRQHFVLNPRDTGFIEDCKEKYLPNTFIHSAYNVFGFEIGSAGVNPLLNKFQELNWSFIISLIVSFVVLLLTFDTISGEKETGTLSVTLSNSISRGVLLFGKYVSVIMSVMIMILIGVLISILILMISHLVIFSFDILTEILSFMTVSLLFVFLIAAIGILSSVIVKNSNVSLLISLVFWLVFIVIIPNSSVFWAKNVFSIEKSETVEKRISEAKDDINRNAPEGSWSSGSDPFFPRHKLRAANQTNLMNAGRRIQNEYYSDMFRQFEMTRLLTMISPVCLYEFMCEGVVGGGYLRFQKVWKDLHTFQPMFLQFFKELDANDTDSPHWYNPYEDFSTTKKPVNFGEVPLFEEKVISLEKRFSFMLKYLILIVIYTALIFFASFVLFVRYDVR